mgnify:CR=1 FL=1
MNTLEHPTVGEFVAEDFRTAAVFSKYGIDFCCKGNRTIEQEKNTVFPPLLLKIKERKVNIKRFGN